ncbi:hypothetical protein C8J57DRAFT_1298018 [Mycena rebaudengoi]|nr:hypothetical protein C8J57DRAFT_1298018 [Mycena rebaudengoi]
MLQFFLRTAGYLCVHLLLMANMLLLVSAVPVDSVTVIRPSDLSVRAISIFESSPPTNDFLRTWGPSAFLDWFDHVAYPNSNYTNYTKHELCQQIGSQLEPLTLGSFWNDLGGSTNIVARTVPLVAQAAVKYSRGDQT